LGVALTAAGGVGVFASGDGNAALRDAQARLDSATRTASTLADELDKLGIRVGSVDGGR
jgi:hypothetical protein